MPRIAFFTLLLSLLIGVAACDSGGGMDEPVIDDPVIDPPPTEEPDFKRSDMLTNIGTNIILPSYLAFQEAISQLRTTGDVFISSPDTASLVILQEALKDARKAWQDVALFQFGPAETFALRGVLNTYPANTVQIEKNMESGGYALGTIENIAAGGFPAFDYLLYGIDNTPDEIVDLFTSDANASSRMAYLEDNLNFVEENTNLVVNRWLPSDGNYLATFLSEDKGGVDVGSSLGELVNAIVLHYERFIRDGKIGIPAGVRSSGVPRPKATEAFYGGYSRELAVRSVEALERLYKGTTFDEDEGVGLEENLEFLDADMLASDISSAIEGVMGSLEALSDPLSVQIESNTEDVVSVFTEMQQLVVLLKADMTSFLGVTITFQDTDGD